jgi:hypothetical protein
MQTTVKHNEALRLFFEAASHWADEESRKENEAHLLREAEEQSLAALPWYRRWFYSLDDFTGFKEDLEAIRCGERKTYCYKQLEILNTLSHLSTVRLSQRDLDVLNLGE